jgi:hypothetical protein
MPSYLRTPFARNALGLASAALLALASAGAQAGPEWLVRINGSFQSRIFNGGSLASGETILSYSGTTPFGGSYGFSDGGSKTLGTLSGCAPAEEREVDCTWSDRYGSGQLQLRFSEDFTSFEGYWGYGKQTPQFRWSGTRRF